MALTDLTRDDLVDKPLGELYRIEAATHRQLERLRAGQRLNRGDRKRKELLMSLLDDVHMETIARNAGRLVEVRH